MKKFNCLIIDDEPIACDIITGYCGHLSFLNVVAVCGNALEAKTMMSDNQIDIIFLDINMPVLDGISFMKTFKYPPQVIFTTAYKEYAVDAFNLTACDYLLKPFSLERFMVAVDKAVDKLTAVKNKDLAQQKASDDHFFIKAEGKIFKIDHDELLYAEAKGNYTKIVTTNKTILPVITFSNFEKLLESELFIKIHRSYIINKSKIDNVEGNRVHIKDSEIPIGSNYKDNFLNSLGL